MTMNRALRTLIAIATITGASCDKERAPVEQRGAVPSEPDAVAVTAPVDASTVELEVPEPPPLPQFADWDAAVRPGVKRLSKCGEFEEFVGDGLVDYHLRTKFPEQFGKPIEPRVPIYDVGAKRWATDESWLYLQRSMKTHGVDLAGGGRVVVEQRMYASPSLWGARNGLVFMGRSSQLRGAEYVKYSAMGRPPHARSKPDWVHSGAFVYERDGTQLVHRRQSNLELAHGQKDARHIGQFNKRFQLQHSRGKRRRACEQRLLVRQQISGQRYLHRLHRIHHALGTLSPHRQRQLAGSKAAAPMSM